MRAFTFASLLIIASIAGCADEGGDDNVDTTTGSVAAEGSPEALGLIGFLNSPATTVEKLDIDVGLDSRAANALVAHRDGADKKLGTKDDDKFDTVAEVDAVSYIGPTALDKLVAYCVANGLVPQADDVLGTYDDVVFTIGEGQKTLAFVNDVGTTEQELDVDLALDSRAAKAIVAARPIASIEALAKLSYVGTTALRVLKQAANTPVGPTGPTSADVAAHVTSASQDLLHTSESDYPFVVVHLPGAGAEPLTAANLKAIIGSVYVPRDDEPTLAEREVEVRSLASFFDRYTVAKDWWDESYFEEQAEFQALRTVFETELIDVQVFRLGTRYRPTSPLSGAIDVFILGRTLDGAVVGVSTVSVET